MPGRWKTNGEPWLGTVGSGVRGIAPANRYYIVVSLRFLFSVVVSLVGLVSESERWALTFYCLFRPPILIL